MNGQLEDRRAVATLRCARRMGYGSRLTDRITEEDVIVTFEDRLTDNIVVRLVNRQDQGDDAVTTGRLAYQGVAVDALIVDHHVRELVARSLAHSMTDGVEDLLAHTQVKTVEQFLTFDHGIIANQTGAVVLLFLAAPAVIPYVRQVVVADGYYGIYHRMNGQLEDSRAVAALRRTSAVVDRCTLTQRVAIEDEVAAFENILFDHVVVRLVNRQNECMDTVATVSGY